MVALSLHSYRPNAPVRVVKGGCGVLIGHDAKGRALVAADQGGVEHFKFNALMPLGEAPLLSSSAAAVDGMAPRFIHGVHPRLAQSMMAALRQRVVGTHSASEYASALLAAGHEVFVVGGSLRDGVHAVRDRDASSFASSFGDLDLSTSATPKEVERLCQGIACELVDGGRFSSSSVARKGMVGFGQRKQGVDIASLRSEPVGGVKTVLGRRLVDDVVNRDFTANGLYLRLALDSAGRLEPSKWSLIDPTGRGLRDASRRILHVGSEAHGLENPLLSLRFLKFRLRGFEADDATRALIRRNASKFWPTAPPDLLEYNLRRISPSSVQTNIDLRAFGRRVQRQAHLDGVGDLFDASFEKVLAEPIAT